MTSIAEFIKVRENIEKLVTQITHFVELKSVQNSREYLDKANQQLEVLKTMVSNDTQVNSDIRLSAQLAQLGTRVEKIEAKAPARKTVAKKKQKTG